MAESPYQNIAIGEIKGWIRRGLFHLLPSLFFKDPVASAKESGGKCIRESKWRWAGFLDLPEGKQVFLKRDLTKDWIESLKYMLLPSKGRKEWFIAYQAGKRHLNIPKPLGWMERVQQGLVRESYYLSEAIASMGSLAELTDILKDEKIRAELVKTIVRMHNTGLFHQDLHAGNFLWDGESLFLIDLHRARLLRSLSLRQRLWNVAQLFHSLRTVWGKKDYEKFLLQYFEGDSISLQKKREYLQQVYFDMDRLQKRQWKSRTKRCLKESTEFSVKEEDGVIYYHRRDFPLDRLKRTVENHLAVVQQTPSSLVKQSLAVTVSILPEGGSRICVKQFCYPHWRDRLKARFRRSKGCQAWLGGHGLGVRGVSSLTLHALVEQTSFLGKIKSILIMEAPESGEEMDRFLCKGLDGGGEKRQFIKAFAFWLGELHQRDIHHRDMKACNILVSKINHGWDFKLLDLEDVRLDVKVNERRLFKTLLQLNTSIPSFLTPKDRLRFLSRYLKRRPILRDKRGFLFRLITKSRERGTVYVSPYGVVEEKFN
jgi:tRNA A-37 threonylcarbamoyl transferase component Bud32